MDIRYVGEYLDFAGVAVMVLGAVISVPTAVWGPKMDEGGGRQAPKSVYLQYRQLAASQPKRWMIGTMRYGASREQFAY